ncbi:unnamed protein product [Medioppia subpectinata]|uniref:HTTM-like domain-containing protein n=1 Tax=Medioppia subpectinata TaxID=1979941 RepID=A0A7R9L512_9ACAR|nr:unnamed protein product [Medioppia subpectinata]CAG2115458.1 unnamed protein product [Medioppia subpectinata]
MGFNFGQKLTPLFNLCDPSGLAVTRIVIGVLLLIDIVYERGLSRAETIWSDPNECRFPLFDALEVLPFRWMCAIYALMFIGNVGIILGLKYRISCIVYLMCYWYLFLLDKSRWNNHSYLFGLLVTLLSTTDSHYIWSLDNFLENKNLNERQIPFWQYFLIRIYFMAGLKKIDADWLNGYSMNNLSDHWVFSPFSILLPNEMIDLYVVHLGGFVFDLTIGFFLVWNKSRFFAYFFCLLFNSMNSRLFSIGMFPYVMIAIMPVFSAPDWPKQLILMFKTKILKSVQKDSQRKVVTTHEKSKYFAKQKALTKKEKITWILIMGYLSTQLFLPHSHWITKGYNTWTNGLYGYSWDMMVHNWRHIHTTVTVVDKSMRKFYLNPETWTKSMRWSHHSDMVKQYALCAHKRLIKEFNITDPSIHIDSWISLNGRFAQRVYDPRVDLVRAEWSPFKRPDWVLPILSHLTDWRHRLKQYEHNLYKQNDYNSVIFIADFPGLTLNNYIGSEFGNTSLTVLKGWLKIEVDDDHYTRIMSAGDHMTLPVKRFHRVTPIKSEAAAYMFTHINATNSLVNDIQSKPIDVKQDIAAKVDDKNAWIRSLNM